MVYDLGELWVVSRNGNDPAELERVHANMEKHRLDLLNASLAKPLDVFALKLVPPDTPGVPNLFGVTFAFDLRELMQTGAQAVVDATTLDVRRSVRNPFPPNQGFAEVRGTVNNLTPHSSIEMCCLGGSEIAGIAGSGGSFSMVIPDGLPGVSYSNMTLRVRDIVASSTQATFSANLQNLSTSSPLTLPLFTVPRDCYGEYDACVAPCPVGGFAGIQCVNACLAALNACLGP